MKPRRKPFSITAFLFESKVAVLMILLNVAAFYYFHYYLKAVDHQDQMTPFILYPGNLLRGRVWCLVTSGFLHSDWTHLLFNMLGVFIFARIVERRMGVRKTLLVYFGALVLSMLVSSLIYAFWLKQNVAIIGASGAVMGLISAAMLLAPFSVTYEMILPIPTMVKGWMFFYADLRGFLSGEKDGISHLAHLCGFLSIALLVYVMSEKDRRRLQTGMAINLVSFVVFLLMLTWFRNQSLPG